MLNKSHPFRITFNDAYAAIPTGASGADAMVIGVRLAPDRGRPSRGARI